MLYPGSAKPLYGQLKDIIIQKIESGELKQDSCVPGERQLAEMYGVSRVTVRQAIGELVKDGVLYRRHGKGTFVSGKRIEHVLGRLIGVAEEFMKENTKVDIQVIYKGFEPLTPEISKNLSLGKDTTIFTVVRLILTDDQPLVVNYTYMPQNIGYIINTADLRSDTILPMLERYGYKLSHAEQTISADKAASAISKYLEYKSGSPVLLLKRVTFVDSGLPILYEKSFYRADRYEYRIDLKRCY